MTKLRGSYLRSKGAVLIVGLILLAMVSLLGVASYIVAAQEERMAGNEIDRMRAFEATEASLRHCESVLAALGSLPAFDGHGGLYVAPPATEQQVSDRDSNDIWWTRDENVRVLSPAIPDLALQPRCIIEQIGDIRVKSERLGDPQPLEAQTIYRITAVGYGVNADTSVQLQSTYRR